MCGITGFFLQPNAAEKARQSLVAMKERGTDSAGIATESQTAFAKRPGQLAILRGKNCLGQLLHSVVGAVKQPLKGKGLLVANCEIYNWKELCKRHGINAGNDAELLLKLAEKSREKKFPVTLGEFDGVWSFAYWEGKKVFLCRDIMGEKPLWYSLENGLSFASEKKALETVGCKNVVELNPRHAMVFDLKNGKARFFRRSFFPAKENSLSFEENKRKTLSLLEEAARKRVPEREFGLLFSGGIDSVLLALLFKKMGLKFKCFFGYAEGIGEPKDLSFARQAASQLGLELEEASINIQELPAVLEKIVPLIESSNPIKAGVALPLYLACRKAKKEKIKVVFSGLGADELFCGYARFRESNNVLLDSRNLLLQMHENDLYRDDVITMNNNLELRLPFLDTEFARFALTIKKEFKLSREQNKIILRKIAEELGLEENLSCRKKTAAQYGSNSDKAIEKLSKQSGAKGKAEYLQRFAKKKNLKIAALFSGGKDSCLALWIMQRQNYDVCCLVSIIPKHSDSFMYHRQQPEILKLQSGALGIPLITKNTAGKKEKELKELRSALKEAKKRFGIQGIVSGALYSNYQRERIQRICDELQLKLFSPLWHKKQKDELHELIDNGFEFVLTKIAAMGLGKEWLGTTIEKKWVAELEKLNKKIGLNVAGEGGEFESLVLNAPNFHNRIRIVSAQKTMRNEFTGELRIKKTALEKK